MKGIFGQWPQVSVLSVIDVLVLAFIIYQFLKLVRGTRAAPMLVGVAVLALALYVAHIGELKTVNWVVATLLPYAIFAMIVVFQGEIRHALAKLGRQLTFARGTQSTGSEAYDDIVLAANLFSQNQTGALIVIEREIGLRTYVESGVPLDARLSYDLLATVFRPSAPLHDGAVIVQKDRIAAAACFLPLSMNPVLSTQLGTRHRAGIGITEETDAVAVIVSEENGSISLAVAGNIERDITVEYLRERLSELLHRYLPPAALPTPITDGAELDAGRGAPDGDLSRAGSPAGTPANPTSSRLTTSRPEGGRPRAAVAHNPEKLSPEVEH